MSYQSIQGDCMHPYISLWATLDGKIIHEEDVDMASRDRWGYLHTKKGKKKLIYLGYNMPEDEADPKWLKEIKKYLENFQERRA